MAKRIIVILTFLICCFCLITVCTQAAYTTEANELILPEKECSLTISYGYDGLPFSNIPVKLYKIADVSADFQYTLTEPFKSSELILNGIQTTAEWNVIRSTLEAHIIAHNIKPDAMLETDSKGQVHFESLKTGLYLVISGQVIQEDFYYYCDSALISLPNLDTDGFWQYQVAVTAKTQVLPPIKPDEEIQFKVLKLWRGDEGTADRPKSIEVEIFRDGISYETVILSEENHWSYSWSAKDDGASWMVVERNIPDGYKMTLDERGTSFVLINTLISDDPDLPTPPPTGDTSNILLYIVLMIVSGILLFVLGITGKRIRL